MVSYVKFIGEEGHFQKKDELLLAGFNEASFRNPLLISKFWWKNNFEKLEIKKINPSSDKRIFEQLSPQLKQTHLVLSPHLIDMSLVYHVVVIFTLI